MGFLSSNSPVPFTCLFDGARKGVRKKDKRERDTIISHTTRIFISLLFDPERNHRIINCPLLRKVIHSTTIRQVDGADNNYVK